MDNVIFEDPSKPRIRSNRHVAAAPTGLTAFSSRGGTHEIEPQAVTTVYESRPQEHSHTSFGGYSGKLEWSLDILVLPTVRSLTGHSRVVKPTGANLDGLVLRDGA